METQAREETERIIRMLRTALRLLGFTNREIERRLGYTPSYLTRLFGGQIELRFEHVVDIANAMGMTAEEFFQFSYPLRQGERSGPAMQLDVVLDELRPAKNPEWTKELENKLGKLLTDSVNLAVARLAKEGVFEPNPVIAPKPKTRKQARPMPPRSPVKRGGRSKPG